MSEPYSWLTERVDRARRVAHEVGVFFEWSPELGATQQQVEECALELHRIGITLSVGHAAFLCIANGAKLVWEALAADGDSKLANTITIFSTEKIRDAARGIYLADSSMLKHPVWMPQDFWEPTLPCIDLQDANYLAIDPRIVTNGEYAIVWAGSELGPLYGDGVSYLTHSFEACLIQMLDMIGLRRQTPEFWHARHESLRTGWMAPDNWHWTNFAMAPRYRSNDST